MFSRNVTQIRRVCIFANPRLVPLDYGSSSSDATPGCGSQAVRAGLFMQLQGQAHRHYAWALRCSSRVVLTGFMNGPQDASLWVGCFTGLLQFSFGRMSVLFKNRISRIVGRFVFP